jgi:ADP-dependent NAD(P)H-hydrate dehydratase / NAD(P)H-hydrate epimerase
MEAAGWECARACGDARAVAVVCGTGNNGGDGLAAARHLHRWGRLHSVACLDPARLHGPAASRGRALHLLGVQIADDLDLAGADLVLDAIFGTGLARAVEGKAAQWIERINVSGVPALSVDVPSGIDSDTGEVHGVAVRAARTVTLGLPKPGLRGEFVVADIGIPREAYAAVGIQL